MFETLIREIVSAEEKNRPLRHVRVTPDAIRGTTAALPMTPERLRALGLGAIAPAMEITIHPEDFDLLVREAPASLIEGGAVSLTCTYGVPVV